MSVTIASSMPTAEADEEPGRTGLLDRLRPWVRLAIRHVNWEEGEELRSRKILVRARPGVELELLSEDHERSRFHASLSRLNERGYYQLKIWPRTTRDYCEDDIQLLATHPSGREKMYTIRALVD